MYGKSVVVYEGERVLGEVVVYPTQSKDGVVRGERLKEIRISHYSQPSERCPPLAVLHTITSTGIAFKLESSQHQDSPLSVLHATCLRDNKTAVMSLGGEELHLVAMHSRKYEGQVPCFWGFNVASGLYNSCLVMLNLRCLGIVFDLDETLIVANTMRSFEDRIGVLLRKINSESDPQRVAGMMAEFKRYQDDKGILKQYAENDQVIDNGKVMKSQPEVVPALSNNHQPIVRPLIRLQDKNIILTRINPLIRDTSILVRLRPAWEDLRNYLTARGRKRFEVFVCTMAERDYALEMWRLLDPESNLIDSKELLERIVCVKAGCRKSLFNVFQVGNCHPKMALVIDDRLKVWDEKDQPCVHVVPAFAPYYAPQAEANKTTPILCVARNVACNVRGGFFKEFDEVLLQRMSGVAYEDDIKEVPSPPDVSNYLILEDDPSVSSGNKDSIAFDGMADAEVERRLLKEASSASSTAPLTMTSVDPRIASALHSIVPSLSFSVPPTTMEGQVTSFPNQQLPQLTALLKPTLAQRVTAETTLQNSPAREEGEVPESELDPDTRRRLLILQHGQDTRDHASVEPQFPAGPPMQVSAPRVPACGWFPVEEEMSPRQLNRVTPPKEIPSIPESIPIDKHRPHHPPFIHKVESSVRPGRVLESQRQPNEALPSEEPLRLNQSLRNFHSLSGEDAPIAQPSSGNKDPDLEAGQIDPYPETPAGALQDIAYKCGTKVDFRQALVSSMELQFSVEVLFAGEKIGEGIARTRREAQHEAATGSLMNLADKYLSRKPDLSSMPADGGRFANSNDNGFIRDAYPFGYQPLPKEDATSFSIASESLRILDPRLEASKKSMGSITELKELCMMQGLGVAFQTQPQFSANPGQKKEVYAQVEIDGHVLGKGIGLTWDEAKTQAAEKALGTLRSMPNQFSYKRQDSPRSLHGTSNKRFKPEFSRSFQRAPSSARYPRNASPML
ncbi:unnamed protein product [Fraxinus pennsylvanica]|uniref:protein-serine/threonine phosphatase n=1 Tax=Fraxinus pennsylvanica TaxID=56036 RepID=A0AAD1ZRI7_9LAMI|nr:unnamed protein product [Fraxinus pennsylvanica]